MSASKKSPFSSCPPPSENSRCGLFSYCGAETRRIIPPHVGALKCGFVPPRTRDRPRATIGRVLPSAPAHGGFHERQPGIGHLTTIFHQPPLYPCDGRTVNP